MSLHYITKIDIVYVSVPLHFPTLQAKSSLLYPTQSLPPFAGYGCTHPLNLYFLQLCSHVDHEVHSPQPPFTEPNIKFRKTLIKHLPFLVSIVLLIQVNTSSVILANPPGSKPQDVLEPKLAIPAVYLLKTKIYMRNISGH